MPSNKINSDQKATGADISSPIATESTSSTAAQGAASSTTSTTARPSSISEALKLIDDVINRDGANLRELVTSEYENLRRAIDNVAPNMGENVSKYGTQAVDALSTYGKQGIDQGRKIATQVDSTVRTNPWPVISGVALGSLALGFMLGKSAPVEPTDSLDTPDLH